MKDDASAHHSNEDFISGKQTTLRPGSITHTYATCPVEYRRVYEGEYFAKYRIDARLKDDMWNWYSNTGVDDPLLVLWELVPYSFVADWFANIGSFIDSLNAYEGLTPLVSCFTYGRKLTVRLDIQKVRSGYWNTKITDLTVIRPEHATYFEFTRIVGPPPAMGSLRFNQRPLNTKRLLDTVSLITQGMRR